MIKYKTYDEVIFNAGEIIIMDKIKNLGQVKYPELRFKKEIIK